MELSERDLESMVTGNVPRKVARYRELKHGVRI